MRNHYGEKTDQAAPTVNPDFFTIAGALGRATQSVAAVTPFHTSLFRNNRLRRINHQRTHS
jgi:hypothetical protein